MVVYQLIVGRVRAKMCSYVLLMIWFNVLLTDGITVIKVDIKDVQNSTTVPMPKSSSSYIEKFFSSIGHKFSNLFGFDEDTHEERKDNEVKSHTAGNTTVRYLIYFYSHILYI